MSNSIYVNNKKYFKSNYSKVLESLIPKYLLFDDLLRSGEDTDIKDVIINSHIALASNLSSIINISGIPNTSTSSINSLEGIYKYFIKQNDLLFRRSFCRNYAHSRCSRLWWCWLYRSHITKHLLNHFKKKY